MITSVSILLRYIFRRSSANLHEGFLSAVNIDTKNISLFFNYKIVAVINFNNLNLEINKQLMIQVAFNFSTALTAIKEVEI